MAMAITSICHFESRGTLFLASQYSADLINFLFFRGLEILLKKIDEN